MEVRGDQEGMRLQASISMSISLGIGDMMVDLLPRYGDRQWGGSGVGRGGLGKSKAKVRRPVVWRVDPGRASVRFRSATVLSHDSRQRHLTRRFGLSSSRLFAIEGGRTEGVSPLSFRPLQLHAHGHRTLTRARHLPM